MARGRARAKSKPKSPRMAGPLAGLGAGESAYNVTLVTRAKGGNCTLPVARNDSVSLVLVAVIVWLAVNQPEKLPLGSV